MKEFAAQCYKSTVYVNFENLILVKGHNRREFIDLSDQNGYPPPSQSVACGMLPASVANRFQSDGDKLTQSLFHQAPSFICCKKETK